MKTMNIETAAWRRGAMEGPVSSDTTIVVVRRRRRNLIIGAVVALLALAIAAYAFLGGDGDPAAPPADAKAAGPGAGKRGGTVPSVSVIIPGRTEVAKTVSATGSLAARRDMPVGVAGEGGLVTRVFVDAGAWVGAGQVLASIERSVQSQEAQQLAAAVDVARADARLAQQELERAQALVGRGFVSKADVERRIATRDAANARVKVAQAQLGANRARIGRLDIRSPAAGLVLERRVEPGQVVGGGSGALFRIAAGGEMELRAQLSQADLASVRVGIPVQVTPVGSASTVNGRVWQVAPVIDPQTRLGEARISVPYTPVMRPGGFAEAKITAGAATLPRVPQSAVQADERGNYVYMIDNNNMVVRRDVQIGSVSSEGVSIVQGLSGQERVVLSAAPFLNPGQKVAPRRATAS
jgi:RND family efflux transporter MFP subunit